ncbi:MAG TPA: anti-sigma factor [Puia sp.]|nr:anti-sigma factor [Puia sp.]
MNVQEYIESGIIESYVMGLASEPEKAEFERLCTQYPELVAARRKFEERLEGYASENAVPPPPEVKVKVLEAIGKTPSRVEMARLSKDATQRSLLSRFVAAASVLLLIGMGYLYYQTKQENKDLTDTNDRLKTSLDTTRNILQRIVSEQKDIVSNPNVTVVNMVGTQVAPKSSANIYWDSASSNVYLVVKNMPKLPSDQQYQLWALIDSKPKDLGVFDASDEKVILKMKNTQKAQAFAITIEQKGGSRSPTLQKMQSIGKTIQSQ